MKCGHFCIATYKPVLSRAVRVLEAVIHHMKIKKPYVPFIIKNMFNRK